MSETFLMRDGDIFIDQETGKSLLIEGPSKASQDISESLLTPYDSVRRFGFEMKLLENTPDITASGAAGLITAHILEAIDRLRALQNNDVFSTEDERVEEIEDLQVKSLGNGGWAFLLKVLLESGDTSPDNMIKVSLRHRNAPNVAVLPFRITP